MKIAMVAPIEESVPPKKYGGTEAVIFNVISELHRRGHEVVLLGPGDSQVPCKVVPIVPQGVRTIPPFDQDQRARDIEKYLAWGRAAQYLAHEQVDIIHNHTGPRFFVFFPFLNAPVVSTLHMPIDKVADQLALKEIRTPLVSISNNQRLPMPDLSYAGTVYNGIQIEPYVHRETPDDYLLFLARFSPHKGAREAIQIARASGQKLLIAAKIDSYDQPYFDSCKEMIDGEQIQFVGEVGLEEKVKLLGGARALLAPIQWEEPFGLYAVEAMACGTPVIGISRGSFPEIIVHGKTGFLGSTTEELVTFVGRISELSRSECRRHVETNFTHTVMTDNYIKVYENLMH